jgi:hypothetical protein
MRYDLSSGPSPFLGLNFIEREERLHLPERLPTASKTISRSISGSSRNASIISDWLSVVVSRGSSVSIVSGYGLDDWVIEV